jgi:hypothetical protein
LPAHGDQHGDGAGQKAQQKGVDIPQHRRAIRRQMLLDARAEAEIRPLGVNQYAKEIMGREVCRERTIERGDHGGVDHIRPGPRQPQP